jgi:DNA-binding LacI/PurR family transcriptional regulator
MIQPNQKGLSQIAQLAGVSTMTVSRVLNDSPKVAKATRKKVLAAIDTMDYKPDPLVTRLMALIREHKKRGIRAAIAVVRDKVITPYYQYVPLSAIRERAGQYGYAVEEFFLGQNSLNARRLKDILQHRCIEGVIASPPSLPRYLPDFDFTSFTSVTFGYGLQQPELHRVSSNMTQGILSALAHLTNEGYQRVGIVITEWIDRRADYTYSGALLHNQQSIPKKNRLPMLYLPNESIGAGRKDFLSWFKKHKPDALISFDRPIPEWMENDLNVKPGKDMGFLAHDWNPNMAPLAGIDHRREEVAKAAVDLLVSQLMHNEKGIPDVPRQILIPTRLVY